MGSKLRSFLLSLLNSLLHFPRMRLAADQPLQKFTPSTQRRRLATHHGAFFSFCFQVASLGNTSVAVPSTLYYHVCVSPFFPSVHHLFSFQHLAGWFSFSSSCTNEIQGATPHHSSLIRQQPPYANFTRFIVVVVLLFRWYIQGVCLWRYGPMLLRVITRLSPALTDGLSPAYARLFDPFSFFSFPFFPIVIFRSLLLLLFSPFPFILPLFVAFLYPFNFQTFISFLFDSQLHLFASSD
jgi:hypothetical protein